jgi:hypothetical protein
LTVDIHKNVTINQSTLDLVNAVNLGNQTVWRTSQSYSALIYDLNPQIKFNTSEITNCTITLLNLNYTNLTRSVGTYFNCSNANSVNQSCVYGSPLSLGVQNIYLSCQNNELPLSTSGALSLNVSSAPVNVLVNVSLDNLFTNGLFYEYETTILVNLSWTGSKTFNVTVNGSNIDYNVLIAQQVGSLNSTVFNISVSDIYQSEINGSQNNFLRLTNNKSFSWSYPSWYVMKNISFYLTESNNTELENVHVYVIDS